MSSDRLDTLDSEPQGTPPILFHGEIRRALDVLALAADRRAHEVPAGAKSPMRALHDPTDELDSAMEFLKRTFESCLVRSSDEADVAKGSIGMW